VEQGPPDRSKTAIEASKDLGYSDSTTTGRTRDLALFNLAIDSKLRGCDLVKLQVRDVAHGGRVVSRTTVMQLTT
jgi:hypothetical protein